MYYEIDIAGKKRNLQLYEVGENVDIAAFILFGDVEITQHAAAKLLEKAPDFDIMLTAEAKSIPLIYAPRIGVRLRTYASGNPICHVDVDEKGVLSLVPPAATVKRDKSNDPSIDKSEILEAFKRLGVKRGDTLMVHSSLSACGHIVGGAKTVIESLIEAVGEDGHFFFPSFQRSECFLNGAISRRWDHRPADVTGDSSFLIA